MRAIHAPVPALARGRTAKTCRGRSCVRRGDLGGAYGDVRDWSDAM